MSRGLPARMPAHRHNTTQPSMLSQSAPSQHMQLQGIAGVLHCVPVLDTQGMLRCCSAAHGLIQKTLCSSEPKYWWAPLPYCRSNH